MAHGWGWRIEIIFNCQFTLAEFSMKLDPNNLKFSNKILSLFAHSI